MSNSQIEERIKDDERWWKDSQNRSANSNFGCDPDEGSVGFGHVHIPIINIWDRIFGNCEKGIHKYKQFLLKEFLPGGWSMESGYPSTIEALKTRVYDIRCTRCGRKCE